MTILDLAPGSVLAGRYRIVRPHRKGGFYAALEVRSLADDAPAELQLFPAGLFDARSQVQELARDLERWTAVDSPWVARVREVLLLDADHLALIAELPRGASLRAHLNEARVLPAATVVPLGMRLLEGLAAIHAQGLVHGDVKPYTIHVESEGDGLHPTLVDGGLTPGLWNAKGMADKTALIGTPYYAPIEQFGGDAPDVRSDVYNVATVLYECLTGVLPWPGKTFLEVFQAKLQKAPPKMARRAPDVRVDPRLEAVVVRGCMGERRERYATALEFRAALEELVP